MPPKECRCKPCQKYHRMSLEANLLRLNELKARKHNDVAKERAFREAKYIKLRMAGKVLEGCPLSKKINREANIPIARSLIK